MTTPRDLLIVSLDSLRAQSGHPVERGDMSLALAGAELIDLIGSGAVTLDGDRIVASGRPVQGDRLLDDAYSSLARQEPDGSVDDWLWLRGRELAAAYVAAMEEEGALTGGRRGWNPLRTGKLVPADTPARARATRRWTSREPVLTALAVAVGVPPGVTGEPPAVEDDATAQVLAVVSGAVMELDALRQRRSIEDAAFDNIWRGDIL